MSARNPTLGEVLNQLKRQIGVDTRVALPGKITRYDPTKQLADVKPMVKDQFEEADGSTTDIALPVITNVPVVFPGAGGFRLVFPVAIGDPVLLIFADRSLDAWQDQGTESAPADTRRHHLTDAIAIPGLHPNNAPWSDAAGNFVTIGSDTGAADWAALATATRNEITALRNTVNSLVTTYNGHTHVESGGTTAPPAATATAPAAVGAIASATVKVKG